MKDFFNRFKVVFILAVAAVMTFSLAGCVGIDSDAVEAIVNELAEDSSDNTSSEEASGETEDEASDVKEEANEEKEEDSEEEEEKPSDKEEEEDEPEVEVDPDAEIYEYDFSGTTNKGKKFRLSDNAGKVVIVNFWTTWCDTCVEEFPELNSLYKHYKKDKDVTIVIVNVGESKDTVNSFIKGNDYSIPVVLDISEEISGGYGVESFPSTVIFAPDGSVYEALEGLVANIGDIKDSYIEIVESLK